MFFLGGVGVLTRDDGSRFRVAHVADDEVVPWRERGARVFEAAGGIDRETGVRVHGLFVLNSKKGRRDSGEVVFAAELEAGDGQDDELDAPALTPTYSSADRLFRKWEGVSSCRV